MLIFTGSIQDIISNDNGAVNLHNYIEQKVLWLNNENLLDDQKMKITLIKQGRL